MERVSNWLCNWLLSAVGSSVAGSTMSASLSTRHSDGHYNYNQQQQRHCCAGQYNVEKWWRITAVLQTPGSAQWYCSSAQHHLSASHRQDNCWSMCFTYTVDCSQWQVSHCQPSNVTWRGFMRWACPPVCLSICLSVCLSVCRQNAYKNAIFSKLSNLQLSW